MGWDALLSLLLCDSADAFRKTNDGEYPSIMLSLVGHAIYVVASAV